MSEHKQIDEQSKQKALDSSRQEAGEFLTTNQGVRVNSTNDSLKAGDRGPTLIEDFHFREKLAHFDRERIPERVVHARGAGAHGYFQPYESMAEYTKAKFLQDPSIKTPVFVRFSTVVGFRGSADTVRDVRGFAVKSYTEEGNYDLVGNNMPVFFIQDAIKFPDLVHAIKPEPHNEMPQAAAAHDNFWDFISLMPESMHIIMWVLSDRAVPRSYRMMQGFGIHTFRFVNEQGKARFVKFHWKPILGVHSMVWDEAQKAGGKDPDFHRRDLAEAIEMGDSPEYELGVQIIEEEDEFKFDFDILDSTKIIPEELVPVKQIGKMVLNRNPDNYFAETEQVAFQPANIVPGIDPSFQDHFSQATLFWNSQSEAEKEHLVKAAHFELGKVMNQAVKERMLGLFNRVDRELVTRIAAGLGLPVPAAEAEPNHGQKSPALSMQTMLEKMPEKTIKSRKIAILAADGVKAQEVMALQQALMQQGAHVKVVAPHGGKIKGDNGQEIPVEMTFVTGASVLFDAVYVPGGAKSIKLLKQQGEAVQFVSEAFKHCKAIAATSEGIELLAMADLAGVSLSQDGTRSEIGVVTSHQVSDLQAVSDGFIDAIAQHRYWMRSQKEMVPA
jgi:catalase/putative intracellular protease/amidase